eukprot:2751267-Prymnesium_polylepis.1
MRRAASALAAALRMRGLPARCRRSARWQSIAHNPKQTVPPTLIGTASGASVSSSERGGAGGGGGA